MANVLLVEPFYGGSHKAFADGLVDNSYHSFQLLTLPDSFWKWRMRGGAIKLAERARELEFRPDIVLASDMLSLAEFKSLYKQDLPSIVYMHENQLCYPAPYESHRDVHFGFTNITTCLAADKVVWNSYYHMQSFFDSLGPFLKMMPDHHPSRLEERLREKSCVIYPGVDLASIDKPAVKKDDPPIILWNHRWEFDKKPEDFFAAVYEMEREGLDFGLVVLGENFQVKPRVFMEAKERLEGRILQFGHLQEREEYIRFLCRSSVSVSTAEQENFGMAAVEAAYAGAFPLWPCRLSYPELLGDDAGEDHLYADFAELVLKLKKVLSKRTPGREVRKDFSQRLMRFDWSRLISLYDDLIERTASGG